jgi:hypothetical protein
MWGRRILAELQTTTDITGMLVVRFNFIEKKLPWYIGEASGHLAYEFQLHL